MSIKEIENLCKEICNNLQDCSNTEYDKSLRLLRQMCGLRKCDCSTLTPSQSLSRLLRVHHGESVLSLPVGMVIINNSDVLEKEEHCNKILERIVTLALSMKPSEEKNEFFSQLWSYSGLMHFTISTIENLISHQSHFLEEDILEVFTRSLPDARCSVLEDSKYERMIFWSCNSPRIFCIVTSIFNEVLQRWARLSGHYKSGISVVSQFVYDIRLRCVANEKDFVLLYPSEYHSLVSVLDINPNCFPEYSAVKSSATIATVVELIKLSVRRKPLQTLSILTHFPAWLPYVDR